MATTPKTLFVKDLEEKSTLVSRTFSAPLEEVWRGCTEGESLEQRWVTKPWKTETKTIHFSVGGQWLCVMGRT